MCWAGRSPRRRRTIRPDVTDAAAADGTIGLGRAAGKEVSRHVRDDRPDPGAGRGADTPAGLREPAPAPPAAGARAHCRSAERTPPRGPGARLRAPAQGA